jgi:hypothetical protein
MYCFDDMIYPITTIGSVTREADIVTGIPSPVCLTICWPSYLYKVEITILRMSELQLYWIILPFSSQTSKFLTKFLLHMDCSRDLAECIILPFDVISVTVSKHRARIIKTTPCIHTQTVIGPIYNQSSFEMYITYRLAYKSFAYLFRCECCHMNNMMYPGGKNTTVGSLS